MVRTESKWLRRGRSGRVAAAILLVGFLPEMSLAQTISLSGKFGVSDTGAANYVVPISVPPGTAGMTPSLTLSYNSQGSNGIVGIGWSLDGLPSIGRCPTTWTQDSVSGGVNYDANDRFCFEGQRLVAISGSYGADSTEYRTEVDGYSRILAHGTAGTGPAWFEVHTKSGQVMEFGHTTDSLILAQGKTTARSWALDKVSDSKSNYFTVTYINDTTNGQAYPSRVDYTGNSAASVATYNSVQFVYASRPDVSPQYQAGSLSQTTVHLTDVKTYTGTSLVGDYRIAYQQGAATARSRISSIEICDSGPGGCLPPLTFTWQDSSSNFQAFVGGNASDGSGLVNNGNWAGGAAYIPTTSDVNGDGKSDAVLVAFESTGLFVYTLLGNGNGTFNLIGGNASTGAGLINGANWTGGASYSPITADVNGDGKADIILVSPSSSGLYVYTLLSNGNGTFNLVAGNKSSGASLINGGNWLGGFISIGGDLNGDGWSDVALVATTTSGLYAWSLIGNGDGTFNLVPGNRATGNAVVNSGNWQGGVTYNPIGGDLNGDGKSDIALLATTTTGLFVWSLIGNGDGTFNLVAGNKSSGTSVINSGNWQGGVTYKPVGADLNGDGKSDISLFAATTTGLFVWSLVGNGDGTFNLLAGNKSSGTAVINSGNWAGGATYNPVTGDLNSDGKTDITLVATSSGGLFVWSLVGNGDGTFNLVAGNASNGSPTINSGNWSAGYVTGGGDVNGDGKLDVMLFAPTASGLFAYSLPASSGVPDLLTGITTGLGATTTVTYSPLTNGSIYSKDTTSTFPTMDLQTPIYTVSRVDNSNGIGGTYSLTYSYVGAKLDLGGRGFLGFRQIAAKDIQTNIVQTTNYYQNFPYLGMVASISSSLSSATLNQTTNTYQFSNASGAASVSAPSVTSAPYKVSVLQSVAQSSDLDGTALPTATTANQYDAFGNVTQVAVSTSDGFSKTTANTYTNDPTNWYLGRLTRASVTSVAP